MEKIVCENSYGNKGTFTGSFPYFLDNVEGIHEKSSELSGMQSAFGIGEFYVGRAVNKRNIVIYGYFKNNFATRTQFLYNLFPDNDEGTLYYYEDDVEAKINYRVEKVSISKTEPVRYFTISLICFNPYFTDIEETKISLSAWEGGIEFPFEIIDDEIEFETKNQTAIANIENPTKIDTGMRIVLVANGTVVNPTISNVATRENLTIDYTLELGDIVEITTYRNNKNIVLTRNGIETNINNYLLYGTKYLQLKPGTNNFKISATSGANNLTTEIYYLTNYEAI